jgi:hypothetical protein
MPYNSVAEVPSYVPKAKRRQWMAIFNSSIKAGDNEKTAFAKASGGIKKDFGVDLVAGEVPLTIKSTAQKLPVLGQLFGDGVELQSPIVLFKAADDTLHFFCHPSNCFRDREHEILTSEAHKEYSEWVTNNPQYYPELQIWHTKGAKVGQVEWVDFADDFLCAAGVIYKEYEDHVTKAVQQGAGMSHGFIPVVAGNDVIAYRSFEFTILPVEAAANTFTDFNVLDWGEKDMAFTPTKRNYFKTLGFTDEQIASFEARTAEMSTQVRALGVDFKDNSDTDEAASVVPQLMALTEAVTAMSGAIANLTGATKQQAEELAATKALAEKANTTLEARVEEQFKAKIDDMPKGFVASQASGNVDGERTKEAAGELDFLTMIGQQALAASGISAPIPQAVQGYQQQGGN